MTKIQTHFGRESMKILLSLVVLTGLTSCAHNEWCPTAKKAEAARVSEMNKAIEVAMTDELSSTQAAPVVTMATPIVLNSATIKQIQAKLNSLGMKSGPVDGIKGSMTSSALKRFQTSESLRVDGEVDSSTLNALNITNKK